MGKRKRKKKGTQREFAKKKKESKSDLVCGFGGGPAEIIFILKVEVSGLSDHNKHGQPGLAALVKMTPGSVDSGRRPWMHFLFLSHRFSSSPPTPAAVDVGHHGEFVQSHSVGGRD